LPDAPPPPQLGNALLIAGSVAAIIAVWVFMLRGIKGLGIWGLVVGAVATAGIVVFAVRMRKRRLDQHMALLDQWAESQGRRR
jgi:small neutral amino acid transporter SnatA (MarC family)